MLSKKNGIEVYFYKKRKKQKKILDVLKSQLSNAEKKIYVAMAWFTHKDLGDIILKKSNKEDNLKIKILIGNYSSNNNSTVIKLAESKNVEFYVWKIKDAGQESNLMHHKFCIIDNVVITGSFNWSGSATFNEENILVVQDSNTEKVFRKRFKKLIKKKRAKKISEKSKLLKILE